MSLLVGVHEVDITPPVGTPLCGSLAPRPSKGIEDPLLIRAIVLESEGTRIAYALLDLAYLIREMGDQAVALASGRTGIPPEQIVWATSHSHTSPYTTDIFPYGGEDPVNHDWVATLPDKFAECVAAADAARQPARMSRLRGYHNGLCQNRRIRFKDGREINNWLLNGGEDDLQCIATAGLTDPEIGILAFDDEQGRLRAVLFHCTLHANTNFGPYLSADYPGVVASRIRERYGTQVSTLFLPGFCGDINSAGRKYREVGDALASVIIPKLEERQPSPNTPLVGATKRDITVPYRDFSVDQEERIRASQWAPEVQDYFRRNLEIIREGGVTETTTVLQAWHIGEVGFASFPGEPFVEWGTRIKQDSPFPWTYPVELGGDYAGYFVTQQAWEAGGYESLISTVGFVDVPGTEMMKSAVCEMLEALHARWRQHG